MVLNKKEHFRRSGHVEVIVAFEVYRIEEVWILGVKKGDKEEL